MFGDFVVSLLGIIMFCAFPFDQLKFVKKGWCNLGVRGKERGEREREKKSEWERDIERDE